MIPMRTKEEKLISKFYIKTANSDIGKPGIPDGRKGMYGLIFSELKSIGSNQPI